MQVKNGYKDFNKNFDKIQSEQMKEFDNITKRQMKSNPKDHL